MPDLLEDDAELCTVCWEAPVADRARCADCLAWWRRNGSDPVTPRQDPKLSELEALRITRALATEATTEWLMASDDHGHDLLTLDDLLRRPEWHRRAACRGVGTEAFFPERGQSTNPAKALCGGCDVRQQCLDDAMANGDKVGVWGGTSERERRVRRRSVA